MPFDSAVRSRMRVHGADSILKCIDTMLQGSRHDATSGSRCEWARPSAQILVRVYQSTQAQSTRIHGGFRCHINALPRTEANAGVSRNPAYPFSQHTCQERNLLSRQGRLFIRALENRLRDIHFQNCAPRPKRCTHVCPCSVATSTKCARDGGERVRIESSHMSKQEAFDPVEETLRLDELTGDNLMRYRQLRRAGKNATRTVLLSLVFVFVTIGGGGLLASGIVAYFGIFTQSDEDRERHARIKERAQELAKQKPGLKLPSLPPAVSLELLFLGLGCCSWCLLAAFDRREHRKRRRPIAVVQPAPFRLTATSRERAVPSGMSRWLSTLHLGRDASWPDIRRAYRKLVLEFHPDRNKDPEAVAYFVELTQAYSQLRAYHRESKRECATHL